MRGVRAALVLGAAGLVTMVLGTFLPWLRSGEVQRNSYASFGVLRRLIGFHGAAEMLLRGWPLLGAVCALVVVLAVAGGALAHQPAAGVRVESLGPIVTITGTVGITAAAIVILISRMWDRRASRDRATGRAV